MAAGRYSPDRKKPQHREPFVDNRDHGEGKYSMSDVVTKLQKVFNSTFNNDDLSITMSTRPEDVEGWDSLGHVTLASNIEQEFHVSLDVDELMEMENVGSIVRILEGKLRS